MSFFKTMVDKFEELFGDDDKNKAEQKKAEQDERTPYLPAKVL